jgi:hypothetical protein
LTDPRCLRLYLARIAWTCSGRYQYNWKTTKGVTGCFRLDLGLKDGSVHTADFRLK